MKIYDCFMFFDEEMLLDLRLNIMDKYVDKFIITEATYMHSGKPKKLLFDIKKYSKFKDKIIYIVVDDVKDNIKKPHIGQNSLIEQHQRNAISRGLKNCKDNDLIIISDVDEIPNLTKLKSLDIKKRYAVFVQKKFDYKLNLLIIMCR